MDIAVISPAAVLELWKTHLPIELSDVRTPAEYCEAHVEFARNIPLDQLDPASLLKSRNGSRNERQYVICRFGGRGWQACERLLKSGLSEVANIGGGTRACEQVGLPMVRGKKTISLQRQVRIAAGSLVC
jgi:rhodanese-related sulfurtransferase